MKKASIIVNSKTGTTKQYAEAISEYLKLKELDTRVASIQDFSEEILINADYVFFGCWTNGLMVILQHPEKVWVEFAAKLPAKPSAKVALFTTYKILTGSMFRNMYKHLRGNFAAPSLEIKSRNGLLSEEDKQAINNFIN